MLATIALSVAAAPTPGGMIVCYLRASRHSPTNTEADRYENYGPHRHLVFKFPMPDGPTTPGEKVVVHDPTNLTLGRPVKQLMLGGGQVGATFQSPADDLLVLTLGAMDPQKSSTGEASLIRTPKGKAPEFFVGRCGPVVSPDIDEAFKVQKSEPETRQ